MARRLVEPAEAIEYLGIKDAQWSPMLDQLRLATIDLFERLCDRQGVPFSDAMPAREETHDGTGAPELWLQYPIAAITAITIGRNPAAPTETLNPASLDVLAYAVGDRRVVRVDSGTFGELDAPRVVHVTYSTGDDLPAGAQLAVLRVLGQVYRQRGSEDAASENASGYARTMADLAGKDGAWVAAVQAHKRGVFR